MAKLRCLECGGLYEVKDIKSYDQFWAGLCEKCFKDAKMAEERK